tara:strand:- start:2675 stop:2965 length:291 start_codon:yes stop_codon:yes gene_type:complete
MFSLSFQKNSVLMRRKRGTGCCRGEKRQSLSLEIATVGGSYVEQIEDILNLETTQNQVFVLSTNRIFGGIETPCRHEIMNLLSSTNGFVTDARKQV